MGRMLNVAIVVLVVAWLLGMIFNIVFGFLIHLLLVLAAIALIVRIYLWFRSGRSKTRDKAGEQSSTVR